MEIFYETKELSLNFGGIKALTKVSTQFFKNKIYGIIGPNGAGKTSFFNCLSGDYIPSSGEILFKGKPLPRSKYMFSRLGIYRTYQNIMLLNSTVIDNIKLGYFNKYKRGLLNAFFNLNREKERELEERAMEMLEIVGLNKDYARRDVSQLSYGDQRRVEIARALISSPELILLDEPVAGMNLHEMQTIIQLIQKISENTTLIIVEHHLDFLFTLCDDLYLFVNGNLITKCDKDGLLNNEVFQTEYLGR
jgi:branched-chain amino acid transport system ATP-binding protein